METFKSAYCWNCDTAFTGAYVATGKYASQGGVSETFKKKTFVSDKFAEYHRCPVCKYEDGLEIRDEDDVRFKNIWLVMTEVIRCSDGNIRTFETWTPFNQYENAVTEMQHIKDSKPHVIECEIVTAWEGFRRRNEEMDYDNVPTLTNM